MPRRPGGLWEETVRGMVARSQRAEFRLNGSQGFALGSTLASELSIPSGDVVDFVRAGITFLRQPHPWSSPYRTATDVRPIAYGLVIKDSDKLGSLSYCLWSPVSSYDVSFFDQLGRKAWPEAALNTRF